jgi:hypothetical protein
MTDNRKNLETDPDVPGQTLRGIGTVMSGMCIQAVSLALDDLKYLDVRDSAYLG